MGSADRGFTWSDEETSALLKFWGEHDPYNNNNAAGGNKRNFVIYEKISVQMNSLGFSRSASQCREKIKRMKREYTLTKQFNINTNGPKKLMRFYDQFEKILVEKQTRNQRNTTLKSSSLQEAARVLESPLEKRGIKRLANIKASQTISKSYQQTGIDDNPWAPAVVLIEDEAPSSPFQSSYTVSQAAGPSRKKQKKIASRMSMFKDMMDSVTARFCEHQQQFDNKFLAEMEALEQEQKTASDNIQKMWLEFEERRQKEDQEHELNLLSTFKDMLGKIVNHTNKETS